MAIANSIKSRWKFLKIVTIFKCPQFEPNSGSFPQIISESVKDIRVTKRV